MTTLMGLLAGAQESLAQDDHQSGGHTHFAEQLANLIARTDGNGVSMTITWSLDAPTPTPDQKRTFRFECDHQLPLLGLTLPRPTGNGLTRPPNHRGQTSIMQQPSLKDLTKTILLRTLHPLYKPVTDWFRPVARAWQLTTYVLFITFIVMSHTETGAVTARNVLGAALMSP